MSSGILNINKPKGVTSFNVVRLVKRLSGERRVGHAGTLDPAATGVLPVCLGQGTRVVPFLMDNIKSYLAEIQLGVITDTYDIEGKIIEIRDTSYISEQAVISALTTFTGSIYQKPPAYSAIKYKGRPLYEWTRAGMIVEPRSRKVDIHNLEVVDWQPPVVTVKVVCGKGTYIRSLAHDLGEALGCGASLKSLIRLQCGCFNLKNSVSLEQLSDAFHYGYWQYFIYPVDFVLFNLAAIVVNNDDASAIINGRYIDCLNNQLKVIYSSGEKCRAYSTDGRFLAILGYNHDMGRWQPEKVFSHS